MTAQVVPVVGISRRVSKTTRDVIFLSHRSRRLLWWLLITLQLLTTALLVFLAVVYFERNTPHSLLWTTAIYFIFADSFVFINRFSFTVATGYSLLSAAFTLSELRLVWFSLRSQQLSFGTPMLRKGSSLGQLPGDGPRTVIVRRRRSSLYQTIRRSISHSSATFSVHGSYFDIRQLVSAVIALASQTISAYLSSHSISNLYLNQTYGFVIFLYGISILVYSKLFRHSQLTQRFACLLTDVMLDFVWGCVLPLWMHLPIAKLYENALDESAMDGESTAREIRRVFVLSWPSYLLSIIPFAKSLMTVLELQTMLRDDVRWGTSHTPMGSAEPNLQPQRSSWWIRCAHVLLAVYGCALLGISLSAADLSSRVQRQPHYGCKFRLHPWFSTKEACMKRTIDCSSVGIVGSATELDAALELLDEESLSDLSFAGCDALTMPSTLSRFPTLETIIIERSWISSWPLEATLSDEKFPHLKTVKLLLVDTNETLHGLVSSPLARTVEYIRFNRVPNAATILAPVGINWQHLVYFDCDSCNLTDVPTAVDLMHQLLTLSLVDSRISVLRDDFITRWDLKLVGLWMDGNADLTELSDAVWHQAATCDLFTMQNTNLSAIPDWIPHIARSGFFVYAYGTPLCDTSQSLLANMAPAVRALVVCDDHDDS